MELAWLLDTRAESRVPEICRHFAEASRLQDSCQEEAVSVTFWHSKETNSRLVAVGLENQLS